MAANKTQKAELNVRRRAVGLCSIQLEMWSEARALPLSLNEIVFN
jgi:hypothetical protein